MTVGLPGTGIGGLFYIVLAVMMPFREACLLITGKGRSLRRWLAIGLQTLNAAGIVASLYGTGWVLGVAVRYTKLLAGGSGGGGGAGGGLVQAARQAPNLISSTAAYLAATTLVCVILGVELASLLLRLRRSGSWAEGPTAKDRPWRPGVRADAPLAR